MKQIISLSLIIFGLSVFTFAFSNPQPHQTDPLPSWNAGKAKTSLINFVKHAINKNDPNYIPPEERIATFDQDGSLWIEKPYDVQVIFAFDRIRALAKDHPEWKEKEPYKSVIAGDENALEKLDFKEVLQIIETIHAGMTIDAFESVVSDWLKTARDPRWHKLYTELYFQPMLEVLNYLRKNNFQVYINSGSGEDFIRVYSKNTFGVPVEKVIGSAYQTIYSYDQHLQPILIKTDQLLMYNNFEGKAKDLYLFIGIKKPRLAVGNSIGDKAMLEYTQASKSPHIMFLIHHDDSVREYNYAKGHFFTEALEKEAVKNNWIIISMKNDWKRIFAWQK